MTQRVLDTSGDPAAFLAAAKLQGLVAHPGVPAVLAVGRTEQGGAWREEVPASGRSLGEAVADPGWSVNRALDVARRTAAALAAAHAAGVVHGAIDASVVRADAVSVSLVGWEAAAAADDGSPLRACDPRAIPDARIAEDTARADDAAALAAVLRELLAPFVEAGLAPVTLVRPERTWRSGNELGDWIAASLAREWRRERARGLLEQASTNLDAALVRLDDAQHRRERARRALFALGPSVSVELKKPWWKEEDEAVSAEAAASAEASEALVQLSGAIRIDPELPEARLLAARWAVRSAGRSERVPIEREGRPSLLVDRIRALGAARRAERLASGEGRLQAWVRREGALTLRTDPSGVRVRASRLVERRGRRVPAETLELGETPLREVPIAEGSWVLELTAPGGVVRLPVRVERGEHAVDVPPGGTEPHVHRLPRPGELGPDDVLVPAGWFDSGEAVLQPSLPARRLWADAFLIRRFPVTVAEYVAFLEALRQRDPAAARRRVPRFEHQSGPPRALLEVPDAGPIGLGPGMEPRHPIAGIGWEDAWACALHVGWRLPSELEWEKAARGVDGRGMPWGRDLVRSWAHLALAPYHPEGPVAVDDPRFEGDVSVYGVRGLGGNVLDLVCEPVEHARRVLPPLGPDEPPARHPIARQVRGGGWDTLTTFMPNAWMRSWVRGPAPAAGFRLARSWPG